MAVKDALDFVKKNKAEIVDLKFVDVPGLWQHFSIPAAELTADLFEEGIGFDVRAFGAFRRSMNPTCCSSPTPTRR
jgi:glutamine synthetase